MAQKLTAVVRAINIITVAADLDFVDGETVVIGGKTYTAKATLSDTDGFFQLGASNDRVATLLALSKALQLTGVSGTDYAASTTKNLYVKGTAPGAAGSDDLDLFALVTGVQGNLIALTAGTSAATVTGATFASGSGGLDVWLTELLAGFQLNSAIQEAVAQAQA